MMWHRPGFTLGGAREAHLKVRNLSAGYGPMLVLRGITHPVIFDHAQGGFAAQPIWRLADGEITPELFYRPTFRFLKV